MVSSHLVLPREGHLEQVFHIFAHLKTYHNTEAVYDPSDPVIDEARFDAKDWASSEFGHLVVWGNCLPTCHSPEAKAL
jgi:hypothetical protein